jgi:beta-lactamase regulating signal transducer with metallopeptidase domain
MNSVAIWWSDALLRASLQGGLAVLALLIVSRIWKTLPASILAWGWRFVLAKFLLTLVAPVTIEKGRAASSTGLAAPSLLPLFIFSLSVICGLIALAALFKEANAVRRLRRGNSVLIERLFDGRIEVRESSDVDLPMLVGFGRPLILIPSGMASGCSGDYRMAIEHEVAHWRRRDLAWAWLAFAVRSLFFFHPLVLIALRELNIATEAACDEVALGRVGATRKEYGLLLLKLSQRKQRMETISVAFASACSQETLTRRILHLSEPKRGGSLISSLAFLCLIALSLPSYRTSPKRAESTGATPVAGTSQAAVFSPARMVSAASAENDFERRDFAQKNPIEGKP